MLSLVLVCLVAVSDAQGSNTTVQVVVTPSFTGTLPLCSFSFLQNFQWELRDRVVEVTQEAIDGFSFSDGLVMVYRMPANRRDRHLRAGTAVAEGRSATSTTTLEHNNVNGEDAIDIAHRQMYSFCLKDCSAAGCICSILGPCGKLCRRRRRRRHLNERTSTSTTAGGATTGRMLDGNETDTPDATDLGISASSYVQSNMRSYLSSNAEDANGCYGVPSNLSVVVTYYMGQTVDTTQYPSLNETYSSWE